MLLLELNMGKMVTLIRNLWGWGINDHKWIQINILFKLCKQVILNKGWSQQSIWRQKAKGHEKVRQTTWWLTFQGNIIIKNSCLIQLSTHKMWEKMKIWKKKSSSRKHEELERSKLCKDRRMKGILKVFVKSEDCLWAKVIWKMPPISKDTWNLCWECISHPL